VVGEASQVLAIIGLFFYSEFLNSTPQCAWIDPK